MTQKKTHKTAKLFVSSLVPQIIIMIVSCIVFVVISNSIIKSYVKSETTKALKDVVNQIEQELSPNFLNVQNFTNFAEKNQNPGVLQQEIYSLGKNMNNIDDFYWSTVDSRFMGGGIFMV